MTERKLTIANSPALLNEQDGKKKAVVGEEIGSNVNNGKMSFRVSFLLSVVSLYTLFFYKIHLFLKE